MSDFQNMLVDVSGRAVDTKPNFANTYVKRGQNLRFTKTIHANFHLISLVLNRILLIVLVIPELLLYICSDLSQHFLLIMFMIFKKRSY
jgi:hypothetical protein